MNCIGRDCRSPIASRHARLVRAVAPVEGEDERAAGQPLGVTAVNRIAITAPSDATSCTSIQPHTAHRRVDVRARPAPDVLDTQPGASIAGDAPLGGSATSPSAKRSANAPIPALVSTATGGRSEARARG